MSDVLNARVLLLMALFFLGMTLYGSWQEEHASKQPVEKIQQAAPESNQDLTIPQASTHSSSVSAPTSIQTQQDEGTQIESSRLIHVETDVLKLEIDKKGGDIVYAELKQYPREKGEDSGFILLDYKNQKHYIAQTGLASKYGPDSRETGRALYKSEQSSYTMKPDENTLRVEMSWVSEQGVSFTKIFEFERDTYLIDVRYDIQNDTSNAWQGSFYGQLQRQQTQEKKRGMIGMQTYTGAALYTPEKKFKKISFSDMQDKPFRQTITGGWSAMVEHYFLSAWIPSQETQNDYYTSTAGQNKFNVGSLTSVQVPAHSQSLVQGQLYLGPEIADRLEGVAPGLELTIDYGILWPISQLIFYVMKKIHSVVGNWGWSIILITVFIKALFFKLSAASYRSMGKLRKVQPKIESLKQRYGEDKQKFSQAMMELYKKEKINPLGGCLPILVQIPVFIALYYVLLESVELRQAPFMLWIQDLSARDPYYVLPLLMGASMLLQQKLSPAPPDPMQAKVLMIMPVVFTVLFLTFPAGLVLYWVVNNVLSITQQWIIMRKLEKDGIGHKAKAANSPIR